MNNLPEVRIQYSILLENAMYEKPGDAQVTRMSPEQTEARAEEYSEAWQPLGNLIIEGIQETSGLEFRQKLLDVYVVPRTRAFSDPLVVGTHYDPDQMVDVITHELIHRVIVDNTSLPIQVCPDWETLFPTEESIHTRIHIFVHAIHKAIYLDILDDPERLERDIDNCRKLNAVDYLAAWAYVEKYGYTEIISRVKNAYRDMGQGL